MASTFRSDVVTGLKSILDDFAAAHGDLMRSTWRARPPSFGVADLPAGYIEGRAESIRHDAGTRERLMTPSLVVIDRLTDNVETMDRFDDLVDLLVDHFTTYPHVTARTIWDRMTVEDVFEDGFWGVRFTFGNLSILEGRD